MVRQWVQLEDATIFDNGCGLGTWLDAFGAYSSHCFGLEVEQDRAVMARQTGAGVALGVGETLPFAANTFDFVFSNEVIEHVDDDARYASEMVRVTKPGGRMLLFCPNRWYPVEQHGIYWRGEYRFGNKPLVNYLPDPLRNKLAPHVRAYTRRGLLQLFAELPVTAVHHGVIFGGYDNIENRLPGLGKLIKKMLYAAENTPFAVLGLSHLLVLEKR
ncbi:MAG: class I SAM-dependent methyltransferase [Ardenticatenaceae bacterium]|nr:class I SAM-dependent methyltransferase [Anaerolineales bacterium]MCB8922491.1 class I SAM-dependent methyltransferase [Ardenticatenaceae bacterium]MCB8989960.1 class I SAM-dependent methyltransferase [Ardenticatenaceae bacterium]MCB9005403.1 class I SAM-dependent methyltransferase [Ardenticatenaceae bacterium]